MNHSPEEPRGDWMQTHSGVQFFPLHPRAEDIRIEDIAHALAHQCRFGGHCNHFYSVAQHSVLVSRACDPLDAFWGLLHDATEAYLVDVPKPIKRSIEMAGYRAIEERLERAIAERFGLPWPMPPSVKRADVVLLATERRDIMGPSPAPWKFDERVDPLDARILPWTPDYAKACFLRRFEVVSSRARTTEPAPPETDPSRCAVCAWPLVDSAENGCVRGNCSQRPKPERLYDPARAAFEYAELRAGTREPIAPDDDEPAEGDHPLFVGGAP